MAAVHRIRLLVEIILEQRLDILIILRGERAAVRAAHRRIHLHTDAIREIHREQRHDCLHLRRPRAQVQQDLRRRMRVRQRAHRLRQYPLERVELLRALDAGEDLAHLALRRQALERARIAMIASLLPLHLRRIKKHDLRRLIMAHDVQAGPVIAIPHGIRVPQR